MQRDIKRYGEIIRRRIDRGWDRDVEEKRGEAKVAKGRGVRICEGIRGLTLSATSCTPSSLRNNEKPLIRCPIFKVFRTDDRPQQPMTRTFTRKVGDYTGASAPFSLRTIVPNDSYLFYYEVDHSVYRWISDNGHGSRNDIISDQFSLVLLCPFN